MLISIILGFIYLMNYKNMRGARFVPDLCSCFLGVYDATVDNAKIINTVTLLVKMNKMNCNYDRSVLSVTGVAIARIFMYKVMLLC